MPKTADSARRGGGHPRIAKARNTNHRGTKPHAKRNGAKRRNGNGGGVYKGRMASINPTRIRALKARGLSAASIAAKLKISLSSVYRYARA
jgi:hypothetical protein